MGLNDTPGAERVQIGFFGLRNAGKSSLVNRIANQEVSIVSEVKGTTTDPVKKSMELLPLGPVTLIDTPGFDDEGELGALRVARTKEILSVCDVAVLVTGGAELTDAERELLSIIEGRGVPHIVVRNKSDVTGADGALAVSAKYNRGIDEVKEALAALAPKAKSVRLVADLIKEGDAVVLVIPIDSAAPKGRIILPQQQAIRDVLDSGAVSVVTGVETLGATLGAMASPPALVITDSQVFAKVAAIVPDDVPLTSFSILMARYKGFLNAAVEGAKAIDRVTDKSKILVSEGCTHHRQCEDIGTVKLPSLIRRRTGADPEFVFTSGHGFPEDLSGYDLVIHCGACMLNDNEVKNRMNLSLAAGVPFTNYGTALAHMNGILERCIRCIPDCRKTYESE